MSQERSRRSGQRRPREPFSDFDLGGLGGKETEGRPPPPFKNLLLEIPRTSVDLSEAKVEKGWKVGFSLQEILGRYPDTRWLIILSLVFACSFSSCYVYYSFSDARKGSIPTIIFGREDESLKKQEEVLDSFIPRGNPLGDVAGVVITQGYGVGTHAPAEVWGGVDLAIDSDGDGNAEPDSTWRVPVHATHNGTVELRANTWPGGNCVIVQNDEYRTLYCHLDSFALDLESGQPIRRGELIGYVGSTGQSSGPHLHYEVWENGVNQDPSDFQVLESLSEYQRSRSRNVQDLQAEEALSVELGPYSNLDQEMVYAEIYSAYEYVSDRLGQGAKEKIKVMILGNQGCNLSGFADTVNRRIVIYSCDQIPYSRMVAILAHELGHQLAHDLHGASHLDADPMLLEGFATWLAGKYWLGSGSENFRDYVRENYGGNPDRLSSFFIAHPYRRSYEEMNELYYKWASFCEFLIEKYGMESFDELYRSGQKTSGSANYDNLYRKTLDELILEWKEWILEE